MYLGNAFSDSFLVDDVGEVLAGVIDRRPPRRDVGGDSAVDAVVRVVESGAAARHAEGIGLIPFRVVGRNEMPGKRSHSSVDCFGRVGSHSRRWFWWNWRAWEWNWRMGMGKWE